VCHKKYVSAFLDGNSLRAKLLGNLKRNFQWRFRGHWKGQIFPNAGKFCRSQNYSSTEANLYIFADKIIDGFVIEKNSGIKSSIIIVLRPDKPF
jgi:hypothetical protein